MPTIDLTKQTKLKMLVSGNPGIGKTTFSATAMDDKRSAPVLIVNMAGNPETLIRRESKPTIWQPGNMRELEQLLTWIRAGQDPKASIREKLGLPELTYKTLVIDQLAEYQRLQAIDLLGSEQASLHAVRKMEFSEWNQMWHRSVNLARIVCAPEWPTHVIMTVHVKTGEDQSGRSYEPMLWGQSDFEVPGYVLAHAWYTWVEELPKVVRDKAPARAERVMAFRDTMRHVTLKEQYGGSIPRFVFDPTVTTLLDYIEGGK